VLRYVAREKLRTQDISAPSDWWSEVPKCLTDTSTLGPNCLDLQQTCFFCYSRPYRKNV